ncbi:unnamed protein product [Auanema sp. JU1783]|nr:unnamed protein product [Auanema sp. JU1783]
MHPFNVGLNNARVGIIPVAGSPDFVFSTIVGLNGITNQFILNTYLSQTYSDFQDFNHTGQYLNNALTFSVSDNYRTVDNGFRPNITNHVLIYVTTTTDFSDKPETLDILSNNLYGVITVGYGPGIKDIGALQKLAGGTGCAFNAPDKTTLLNKLVPVVQDLVLTSASSQSGANDVITFLDFFTSTSIFQIIAFVNNLMHPFNVGLNNARARVQSGIQLFSGFTTSLVSDVPGLDPVQDSPNNMIISYVHTTDLLRTPILLQSSLYDAYTGNFFNAARYQFRADCSYPWVSQTFTCPDNSEMNEMAIMHYGEDASGYAFQRVTFAHCNKQVLTCGNGGIRSNGTCVCDEYWQGKFCTIPICVNNGTLDPTEQFCECPTGYFGSNCQYDGCTRRNPYFFDTSKKTLAILVEATMNNKNNLDQLSQNLTAMIATATAQKTDWFGNYILVAFNSFQVTTAIYNLPSVAAMQQAIRAINVAGLSDDGNCATNIFDAIDKVLMQSDRIVFPDSQVIIFTASTAGDYLNRGDTVAHFGATEAQLTWVYDTNSKCGIAPAQTDASASHLVRLCYATDGNALFVNSALLSQFFGTYLASRFYVATLTNPTYKTNFKCDNAPWYIQVETSMSSVYITTSNYIGSITAVTDPQGIMLNTDLIYSDSFTKFSMFKPSVPGIYTLNLASPGTCYASVYSNTGAKVYQYFAPTTASDPIGAHLDGSQKTPNAGQSTIATFHTPNRGTDLLKYVQIIDLVTNMPVLSSALYLRQGCSFEYYSDPFVCQSDMIAVIVYGQDRTYAQFKRQLVAFCVNGTLPS